MPYCPKCNDEFQNWAQVCPDCGIALADKLPRPSALKPKPKPKAKLSKEPLVYIATAPNEPLARMWAGILENEGIYSFVKGIDWYLSVGIPFLFPNYEIHVSASQAEKARKILAPHLKDKQG